MNKQKTMRAGIIAAAALVLIGMLFVPAVAAADLDIAHYDGMPTNTSVDGESKITAVFNEVSKTLYIENKSTSAVTMPNTVLDFATLFAGYPIKNDDVKLIDVDPTINLSTNSGLFTNFKNADLYYLGGANDAPQDLFGSAKLIYYVNATNSTVTVNVTKSDGSAGYEQKPTGTALTVDTNWAYKGQKVKVAVQPLQNFAVYGWELYKGKTIDLANLLADGAVSVVQSADPEDGATTYILTMPGHDIVVSPKLRDSGSTIVTYVFLDADTYVMTIPADFSLKGAGKAVSGDDKEVNLTSCELLDGNDLKVTMVSENGYDKLSEAFDSGKSHFIIRNVKTPTNKGAYDIAAKKTYKNESDADFETLTGTKQSEYDDKYGAAILETKEISADDRDLRLSEGTLKTELQFTLFGMPEGSPLGKYKDKLTFYVAIGKYR